MFKKIILPYSIWKICIFAAALFADPFIPRDYVFTPKNHMFLSPFQTHPLVWMFANFDGINYLQVARGGYTFSELGFFPLYPLFIKSASDIVFFITHLHFYVITAEILSNIFLVCALIIIYKIVHLDKNIKDWYLLLLVIFFFPTSFFLGSAYNDSLFLLLACTSIYFSRKRYWIVASIAGYFATLARLNGLALFPYILVEYFMQSNEMKMLEINKQFFKTFFKKLANSFSPKVVFKNHIYSTLLVPLGFITYLAYIQIKFGSYKMLFYSMKAWDQDKMVLPLQVFWRYIKIVFIYPTFKLNYWVALLELVFVILYLFTIIYSYKKIRFSYWIFMVISFLIPSLTGTFQGMPRYGLHLYPFFLALYLFLQKKNKWIQYGYFLINGVLLLLYLILFTNGYFVA